ncbi:hypothetical protein TKK_0016694 [Trichogramma kaykai]
MERYPRKVYFKSEGKGVLSGYAQRKLKGFKSMKKKQFIQSSNSWMIEDCEDNIHPSQNNSNEPSNIPEEIFGSDIEVDSQKTNKFKPSTFEELVKDEGFSEIIKSPVKISSLQLLFLVLKFSVMHKLSVSSLSSLLTLINSIFQDPVLPDSRYMIDKFFNGKPNSCFYAICPNDKCNAHLGKLEDIDPPSECNKCNKVIGKIDQASNNFYVMIDPSNAIVDVVKDNEDYYDYVINRRTHNIGHYQDIYDGDLYRQFISSLSDEDRKQYLTVTFNSDGAAPFKSSPLSVWPIYIMINEVPVQERFKNIIPCALWFNRKKPDMKNFLKVFSDMFNDLREKGIKCQLKGNDLNLKLYALVCCVDTVARAPMQGLTQFNGKYGCSWCLHPTKYKYRASRYPVQIVSLRTVEDTMNILNSLGDNNSFGFKEISPLILLKDFNIIEGFTPDYMHCYLGGVGKQITNYFINSRNVEVYQDYLNKIKFPYQVCRIARPLSHSKYWKCREWENWILYASLPIFSTSLEQDEIEYWGLLVYSLYLLLKENITIRELDKADELLHIFVAKTEKNFHEKAMTFNVHQLLHICHSVKNWGPVWVHSAFAFESGNHELLQAIHSGRGIISQILRYININQCVGKIEKHLFSEDCDLLNKYNTFDTLEKELILLTYTRPNFVCQNYIQSLIRTYTMPTNKIIIDKYFWGNISQEAKDIKLDEISLKRVSLSESVTQIVIPTNSIKSICVYIEVDEKSYICPTPNLFYY